VGLGLGWLDVTPRNAFVCALALVALASLDGRARASDFWDEVKTPGLRLYRQRLVETREALAARRWTDAVAAADAAIARLPDRGEARALRGRALTELGRLDEAIGEFEAAIERDPAALDDPETGGGAAILAASVARSDLALRILSRVLGRAASGTSAMQAARRADLYALQADLLLTSGPDRVRDAILSYREALRQSDDPRVSIGLALALARVGDDLEASDLARGVAAAGRLDGLLAGLHVPAPERAARRAFVLEASGDRAGARAAWAEAQAHEPWREFAITRERALSEPPRSRR
jgi:tetratricopeptide (TPR) repeat protein